MPGVRNTRIQHSPPLEALNYHSNQRVVCLKSSVATDPFAGNSRLRWLWYAELRDLDARQHKHESHQDEEDSCGQVDVRNYSAVSNPSGGNIQCLRDDTGK